MHPQSTYVSTSLISEEKQSHHRRDRQSQAEELRKNYIAPVCDFFMQLMIPPDIISSKGLFRIQ